MAFDGITVANIVYELKASILDGRINKIAQPETDELLLTIKTANGLKRLSISASASLPLIYLTETNKPSPMTAPNFCMLLRKHINNGRITDVTQPKLERIIELEIEHLDELGDLCKKRLIVEIMGKHSNIIFCGNDGKIIDSIKHVSAQMSSVREVLPGRTYFIPDTMEKHNPLDVSFSDFAALLTSRPMPLAKAIYTSFTGISPVVAEEICFISGIDSSVTPKELSEDVQMHLYKQFVLFFDAVSKGVFQPRIYYSGAEPKEFCALPLSHFSAYEERKFSSISNVLETYYSSKKHFDENPAEIRRFAENRTDRSGTQPQKYHLQTKQLRDTENRDTYKVYGELLHTYGYHLEEGAEKLDALNYYTNENITIPLDPQKTAMENAENYFNKYNKQKRTFEALSKLIEETQDDILYLESVSNALDIARSEDDLVQIREELIAAGYVKRKLSKKKVKITSKPFHYISGDGYHMYVGKNNLQNDELTFHFAVGNDWWFHAKGCPGSHVIVKTNGDDLPDRTFEEAGKLAAYYSKNRGNEKVEIDYIEKKYVKKPNGGKPGFVVYYTNYSLMIDSDITAIRQIE